MRQNWWKFLGIAILLYVVIFGMSTPLKPGILRMDVLSSQSNGNVAEFLPGQSYTFLVKGYNTNFTNDDTKAWLKIFDADAKKAGDFRGGFESSKLIAKTDTEANITFNLPSGFPLKQEYVDMTLVISNKEDGQAILPNAFLIKTNNSPAAASSEWSEGYLSQISTKSGVQFPFRSVLHETVRNTFFHIPLWFSMFILLVVSLYFSIQYLRTGDMIHDIYASSMVSVAVLFGILGIVTGSLWAKYTWGTFWTTDVKLNMSTVAMLIYVASLILRSSINDVDRRAKLSASYNIFAFAALIPLVFVIPRMTDSLHPGNGGNPALGGEDMENTLRMAFYPAVIGFTLLGFWISSLLIRFEKLKEKWMTR